MARKNYSEEFRRQAVDLYESTPGAALKGIAADLGVARGTLKHWVDQYGTGKKTAPDGTTIPRLTSPGGTPPPDGPETPEQELARLRARVRELEVETTKLSTEREIPSSGWPSISPGRRTGESLPVRRRQLHHLRGEATV